MKNKIRLIDINIVSSYMGRFLTAIVAVLVLSITVAALVDEDGNRDHKVLVLGVAGLGSTEKTLEYYEPFKDFLARSSGRAVKVRVIDGEIDPECELYLLPWREYFYGGRNLALLPIYSVCRVSGGRDSAVLIVRGDRDAADLTALGPSDVVFAHPHSFNGFLIQLRALESRGAGGFAVPVDPGELHFVGPPGAETRVVYEVLLGRYTAGACRRSDVDRLVEAGELARDEIAVSLAMPALPEQIIACREADREYYLDLLESMATRLASPGGSTSERDTAALLRSRRIRSLRPVIPEEVALAEELYDQARERE